MYAPLAFPGVVGFFIAWLPYLANLLPSKYGPPIEYRVSVSDYHVCVIVWHNLLRMLFCLVVGAFDDERRSQSPTKASRSPPLLNSVHYGC
jgi:hypothetical protein